MKQLEKENPKLKCLVADLALVNHVLKDQLTEVISNRSRD